jgi:NTP pyrophosphatase (non-canonical NTP hydrolase)
MGEGTRVRGVASWVSAGDQDKIEAEFGDVLFQWLIMLDSWT